MSDLSEKVLRLATGTLGPAAKVFLERQTKFHMNGTPFDQIKPDQLPELARWVGISGALVVGEEKAKRLAILIQACR